MTELAPKEGDVFAFSYSEETYAAAGGRDLRWCFDGQLVYRDDLLNDTYWGLGRSYGEGRHFTVEEAKAKGALTFLCNLNDVEQIQEYEFPLYAEGDAWNLSHQHGCYRYFVRRKGAKKSADLMRQALHARVETERSNVTSAIRTLEWAITRREQLLPKIDAGEEVLL